MFTCSTCGKRPPLCDTCLEDDWAHLGGTAAARGAYWASSVVGKLHGDPARWPKWPAWDASERARRVARLKVADLTTDPRLFDRMVHRCFDEAAREYERIRAVETVRWDG